MRGTLRRMLPDVSGSRQSVTNQNQRDNTASFKEPDNSSIGQFVKLM